jgi:DNA (cytosine-5)-methyltransferase 1
MGLTSVELCAGGGGQALGLERAGFRHVALVENDKHACATLRLNRPPWNVQELDIADFDPTPYAGVDLVAAGVPCPPFSRAGKKLGRKDERDLFPYALDVVEACKPRAVLFENVRGLLDAAFASYRRRLERRLERMGYLVSWKLLSAADFGVSQLRPRTVIVAVQEDCNERFEWPSPSDEAAPSVGEALFRDIAENGWRGAEAWRFAANKIAPTLVGGSKKHGGPDLGPTRAKREWALLGVDALGLADFAPADDFVGMPRLTVAMTAVLQGFPRDWRFSGGKTAAYRQVGNAFPPPVAEAVGKAIRCAIAAEAPVALTA